MLPTRRQRIRAAAPVDPTTVRLSEHFLLSDFVGCHSVYTNGHRNLFEDPDGSKLAEGRCLAQTVFEGILNISPVSISYGYISRELAGKIVTYQSPDKPSYHQWNDGAAADVVIHTVDACETAPIVAAISLDEQFPMSRTITYSESPFICVATRAREVEQNTPRRALYENRYQGVAKKKPLFLEVWKDRDAYFKKIPVSVHRNWRGACYPTYHGGGRRQVQHIRVGKYSMLSDFLYSTEAVAVGYKNCPILDATWMRRFQTAGRVYGELLDALGIKRLSVVRAYESPAWSKEPRRHWREEFAIDFIPPESVDVSEVQRAALSIEGVTASGAWPERRIVSVFGPFDE